MKKIIVCILSGFLCAGCVSSNQYRIKCAEAERYKVLSENLSSRLDKATMDKNKLEANNKILTDALSGEAAALTEASTPSKMNLEEAIKIWKQAIDKLSIP